MNNILSFSQFINEMRISQHAAERIGERLVKLENFTLSPAQNAIIKEKGWSFSDVRRQLEEIIVKNMLRKINEHLPVQYSDGSRDIALVAFRLNLGNTSELIRLTVKSGIYKTNKKTGVIERVGEKIFHGEKIYLAINDDVLSTVLVYDKNMTDADIMDQAIEHFEKKRVDRQIFIGPFTEAKILDLTIQDGEVKIFDPSKNIIGKGIAVEQQWAIAPGKSIGVYIPFANKFVDGMIDDVVNPILSADRKKIDWDKGEKSIKFIFKATIDNKQLRIPKKVWIGDTIYLPVGDSESLVACEIVSPGIILDIRAKNPINIKYLIRG